MNRHSWSFAGVALVLAVASPARADDEAKLAQAVRDAHFGGDDKRVAATKLAAKKTPAARKELLKLLDEESGSDMWTQEAAVYGLALLGDREADQALVEHMESHFTHCQQVVDALKVRKSFPVELLAKRYDAADGFKAKVSFVNIASALRTKEAGEFLRQAIRSTDEPRDEDARATAFQALTEGFADDLRPFAVELVKSDKTLGGPALVFIVTKGTVADLPFVLEVAEKGNDSDEALLVAAYTGVAKWADPKVQREKCLAALRSKSEERARAGIAAFTVSDPEITTQICRIGRKGTAQRTRVEAASRLIREPVPAAGKRDEVVPILVATLKEEFAAREETPIVMNLLTLGLAGTFDSLSHGWNKKAFDHTIAAIDVALEKRTGVKNTGYEAWLEWAILQGHTVDGRNLIQQVFAADKAKRKRAQEGAAKLLGSKSREDFVKKTAGLASDDGAVGVALAQKLVEKGLLVDED